MGLPPSFPQLNRRLGHRVGIYLFGSSWIGPVGDWVPKAIE